MCSVRQTSHDDNYRPYHFLTNLPILNDLADKVVYSVKTPHYYNRMRCNMIFVSPH